MTTTPGTPVTPGTRLDPEFRAQLVDIAAGSIQDVWNDVPGGVDAENLAQNVVGAQEFAWIARGFPVAPVTPSEDDEFAPGECRGDSECPVEVHNHGCFADMGNCDEPTGHEEPAPSPDREKLIAEAEHLVRRSAASGNPVGEFGVTKEIAFVRGVRWAEERLAVPPAVNEANLANTISELLDSCTVDALVTREHVATLVSELVPGLVASQREWLEDPR